MRFMNIKPRSPVRVALYGNFIIEFWFFAMSRSLGSVLVSYNVFLVLDYFGYHWNPVKYWLSSTWQGNTPGNRFFWGVIEKLYRE